MAQFMPTTKAQLSGHRFLKRRAEHGLVLGDIRMIHDPLGSRRRSLIFGVIIALLIAAGAGLLAWLKPSPRPGEAPIVRSSTDQLFVLVGDNYHPVSNLTSARLISGQPAEPAAISDQQLAQSSFGPPLGISDAPSYLAPSGQSAPEMWAVCLAPPNLQSESDGDDKFPYVPEEENRALEPEIVVVAGRKVNLLKDDQAQIVASGDDEWLLTARGRQKLPPDEAKGRAIRRSMELPHNQWELPEPVVNVFAEYPELKFDGPLPTLIQVRGLQTEPEQWWAELDGMIARITGAQAQVLRAAGAGKRDASTQEITGLASAQDEDELSRRLDPLPAQPLDTSPVSAWLCANQDGEVGTMEPIENMVELPVQSTADKFVGLESGAVAADTGRSIHVISPSGFRYELNNPADAEVIGLSVPSPVPWPILTLLPEGSKLHRAEAQKLDDDAR